MGGGHVAFMISKENLKFRGSPKAHGIRTMENRTVFKNFSTNNYWFGKYT